ncbi:MAG: BLUF domain-containing protein [Bdellovibrionales bacterium]|nr:BLUF domain-containing protein [Bdellovibrionales bacterium]
MSDLVAVAYSSVACRSFSEAELFELSQQAAARNLLLEVTGYLHFKAGTFFQYLEGQSGSVADLMESIRRDPRHKVVNEVDLGLLTERAFPSWSMRYLPQHQLVELSLDVVAEHIITNTDTRIYGVARSRERILSIIRKISQFRTRIDSLR